MLFRCCCAARPVAAHLQACHLDDHAARSRRTCAPAKLAGAGNGEAGLQEVFLAAASASGRHDHVPGQRRHAAGRGRRLSTCSRVLLERDGQCSSSTSTPSRRCSRSIRSISGEQSGERMERTERSSTIRRTTLRAANARRGRCPRRGRGRAPIDRGARWRRPQGLPRRSASKSWQRSHSASASPAGDLVRQGAGRGDRRDRRARTRRSCSSSTPR